ncbi:unnamed protein product, partial [marine sediment metagenome]
KQATFIDADYATAHNALGLLIIKLEIEIQL